jgi:peptidyl-prolyl cis-trans isomerase C
MNKREIVCSTLLALGIVLHGCSGEDEAMSETASSASEIRSGSGTVPPADFGNDEVQGDATVATVNGAAITSAEVKREAQELMMQYRNQIPREQMAAMLPMLEKRALENLINKKLLRDEIDREGVSVEESAIDEKMAEIGARFPSPEEFEKQLSTSGMTREQLRGEIAQSLEVKKFLEEKLAGALEVSDEDASEYYEQNQESFNKPEEVKASHILIASNSEDSEEVKGDKQKQLADIRVEIVAGADFGELAAKYSECPSKDEGGDLGFFTRERMVPAFSEAAFELEVGGLSDVVETRFGYHLIKVTDRHDAGVVPFEEASEDIKEFLGQQQQQQAFEEYLTELREKGTIEYEEGFAPQPPPENE